MATYDDAPEWFSEKYEKPVVEPYIVGNSGLDPDRQIKPEAIHHEQLDGLLGGDFAGHYHLRNDQIEQYEGYKGDIQRVETEADRSIKAVRDEAAQKITELNEAVDVLTGDVDVVESTLAELEDTTDFLNTRMEVIVGEATEDTEILDARVDAERVKHPNLGHNIRSLHQTVLDIIENIKFRVEEFQGLLQQFDMLAEAQMLGALNGVEAHERRKAEIQQERLTRLLQDDGLQEQINTSANAILDLCVIFHKFADKVREWKSIEKAEREGEDAFLQWEIDEETLIRESKDNELQEGITKNEADIERTDKALTAEKKERKLRDTAHEQAAEEIKNALSFETLERVQADLGLARQASATAEAIMRTALSLVEFNRRRKADILREEGERRNYDRGLQGEIDTLSGAVIGNSYAIHREAEKRRSENKKQREESFNNKLIIEEQNKKLVLALLEQSVIISDEAYKRRDNIDKLKKILFEKADNLQKQVNKICYSILEGAVRLHKEAEQRRREDIAERFARFSGIEDMREQIDTLSEAVIELATILSKTNSTVRTLGSTVKTLEISASEAGTNFASNEEFQAMFSDIL